MRERDRDVGYDFFHCVETGRSRPNFKLIVQMDLSPFKNKKRRNTHSNKPEVKEEEKKVTVIEYKTQKLRNSFF